MRQRVRQRVQSWEPFTGLAAAHTPATLPSIHVQVLIGTLTVFETILYSAKLRLPQVGAGKRKGWMHSSAAAAPAVGPALPHSPCNTARASLQPSSSILFRLPPALPCSAWQPRRSCAS